MKNYLCLFLLLIPCLANGQWEVIHASGNNGGHRDLYFLNNDTGFVIGNNPNGSYVLRTHDGGTEWDSLWYDNHQFKTIFFPSADTGYISTFYFNTVAVMRTINGGDSWQRVADSLGYAISVPYAISFFNNNTGIITLQGWAAKTVDAGVTWTVLENYPGGGTRDGDIGSSQYVGLDGRIIINSEDQGETFVRDTLDYQGSHYFLKAKDHRFISSAIGSSGQSIGYPNNSFGVITRGNVLTREWKITYFPFLSRVYDLSWPSENVIYAVHNFYYTKVLVK